MRTTNGAGVALIKAYEELRLRAYDDQRPRRVLNPGDTVRGRVTIGWGHTRTARPGMVITEPQAEALFRADLASREREVSRVVKVPLTDNEFAALVSFEFNTGGLMLLDGRGRERPSRLLAHLNAERRAEAADEFLSWRYDDGVESAGLLARRRAERALFLTQG